MLDHVALQAVQVGSGGLHRVVTRLHQLPGGIVDEGDQAALGRTILQPGMRTAVNLQQLAQATAPRARAVEASEP